MNDKGEYLLKVLASKHFTLCVGCAQEIDLRETNHKQIADGYLVHLVCPPITPKFT